MLTKYNALKSNKNVFRNPLLNNSVSQGKGVVMLTNIVIILFSAPLVFLIWLGPVYLSWSYNGICIHLNRLTWKFYFFLFQHVNLTDDSHVTCELGEEGKVAMRHRFLGGEGQGVVETTTKITNGSQLY